MSEKLKIIIADDQKLFREGLRSLILEYDISIIGEAQNGLELLELLKTQRPHIVLLDIEMPELDGFTTLKILAKEHPGVLPIILSTYNEEELIRQCFLAGAKAYLTKDTDIEKIVEAMQCVKKNREFKDNLPWLFEKKRSKQLFSQRETNIIRLLCNAKSTSDIARELFVVEKTIEYHITEIYKKTDSKSRAQFLIYATKEGLNYL